MTIVDERSKTIQTDLNLEYLNNIYKMKEKLSNFEHRKTALQSKMVMLSAAIDKKLSHNKVNMLEKIDKQKKKFESTFREHVDADVKELKQMGEIEYNFKNMIIDTNADRKDDMEWLNSMIHETVNDEFVVYQKQEATKKLLISQINFLKQRLKVEIESRETTDEDI